MEMQVGPWPEIDTAANQILGFFGRKGSGKSKAAQTFYRHWPNVDKITIDVNGDAEPGEDAEKLRGEPPKKMPERKDDGLPLNLHYLADPGSATYRDNLDRAIGTALFPQHRRTLLWVDEVGEVTQANKTPPNLRTLLMQSRHFHASALLCGPRPMNIDPLCLAQADRVFIFDMPNEDDRDRVAKTIGWPREHFEAAYREVRRANAREPYHFLQYVAGAHELYLCPPLPKEWIDG